MKKPVTSIIQYLIFLSIGLGLLWLVFRKIDLKLIREELSTINYFWISVTFLAGILSHLARAIRWNLLIGSMQYRTSTLRTFYAVMVGYLANLAIPRIGEVTRCGILSKTDKIPVNSLIGTVISERIFDMVVLLLITVLVILFQLDLVGGFVAKYLVTPLLNRMNGNQTLLVVLGIALVAGIFLFILFLRKMLPTLKGWHPYQRLRNLVTGFLDGILTIKRMKRKGRFLFWTLVIWGNYFLMTYLCFFAMPATSGLGILDGLTVLSLGSFGIVAPLPGGIGAYHFIVKAILVELYHLPAVSAASFATVAHFTQTLLLLILGSVSYFLAVVYLNRRKHGQTGTPQP